MHLEIRVRGGREDEADNAHNFTLTNEDSKTTNVAQGDIIVWEILEANCGVLKGGDVVNVHVLYEADVSPDVATDAYFKLVKAEYI